MGIDTARSNSSTASTAMPPAAPRTVVLFNDKGSGHVNPMLALAERLVSDGWQVCFFTAKPVRTQVEGTGATWCHYGREDWDIFDAARRTAERLQVEPDSELSMQVMPYACVPATLDVLPFLIGRMAQLRPAFIMFDAACPWGWVLSQLLRIPAVCSMTASPAPHAERENASSMWSSTRVLDATTAAIRAAYGIELNHNYSYANYTPYTIVWSSRSWHQGHEEFNREQFHYWGSLMSKRKSVGEGKAGDCVKQTLDGLGDRKLVFVSLGTVATGAAFPKFGPSIKDFYRKMCAVASSMPETTFIFALGGSVPAEAAEDGRITKIFEEIEVPPNTTAAVSVDQLAVLEHASLFVSHCGQNSSSEAVANRVPVVAMPFFCDQLYNAARFEELGCGLQQRYTEGFCGMEWKPDHSRITEASLGTAVRRVLEEPQFKEAVCALRAREIDECGQPFVEKLANMLEYVDAQPAENVF